MKIITQGTAPDAVVYTGKCKKCGTELEAVKAELKTETHRNEMHTYADCLTCGWVVEFEPKSSGASC